MDDATSPETIDVRRDEGVTITFLDGGVADFDLVTLRQGCPCAACRNKRDQGLDAWPLPNSPQPLRIEDARLHGAWALAFTWNDGHATGVYPFESLRRWSDGGPAFGPDSGLAGATDDGPPPGDGSPGDAHPGDGSGGDAHPGDGSGGDASPGDGSSPGGSGV